jgi:hypothetical protein
MTEEMNSNKQIPSQLPSQIPQKEITKEQLMEYLKEEVNENQTLKDLISLKDESYFRQQILISLAEINKSIQHSPKSQ